MQLMQEIVYQLILLYVGLWTVIHVQSVSQPHAKHVKPLLVYKLLANVLFVLLLIVPIVLEIFMIVRNAL